MCTVTVFRECDSLLVTMNRDEQRLRAEEPPRVHGCGERVAWLAPIDTKAQGTWMGVNDQGVAACLLNNYLAPVSQTAIRSRGEIIRELMPRGDWNAVVDWIERSFEPQAYPPFSLVVASLDGGVLFEWEGAGGLGRTRFASRWWMLTSSSWNTPEVLEWRKREFGRWLASECPFDGCIPGFHLYQPEGMAQWAPLMSRENTHTRSITQVRLDRRRSRITMNYWPRPLPDVRATPTTIEMDFFGPST